MGWLLTNVLSSRSGKIWRCRVTRDIIEGEGQVECGDGWSDDGGSFTLSSSISRNGESSHRHRPSVRPSQRYVKRESDGEIFANTHAGKSQFCAIIPNYTKAAHHLSPSRSALLPFPSLHFQPLHHATLQTRACHVVKTLNCLQTATNFSPLIHPCLSRGISSPCLSSST